ncbi:MAG: glutamate 5-kinase [Pseudoflavonifractor sp.]
MKTIVKPLRIVVKVGTSSLTHDTGRLNLHNMDLLARTLSDLEGMGHEIVLVSSGAIGVGATKLGLQTRPTELRMKQAAAAVGQCAIMHLYDKLFGEYNRVVAQILLTGEDVDAPVRAQHLQNTFEALLELGIIPVVNENDSVSSAEIETGKCKVLGDNDTLSAIVARLVKADLLVLLSDIDGLYDADPHAVPDAKLIHEVTEITPQLRAMAGGAGTWRGTGGMATKLSAAEIAMDAGVEMVITNGAHIEHLYGIVAGEDIGTRFCTGAIETKPSDQCAHWAAPLRREPR